MRAHLVHVPDPPVVLVDGLVDRLRAAAPQYVDAPFHRVLALRIAAVSGWAAGGGGG
ncbi:MAG: hypothetical protein PGN29_08865 [Gordonia paraffinivorans]